MVSTESRREGVVMAHTHPFVDVGRCVASLGLIRALFGGVCEMACQARDLPEGQAGWSRVAIVEGISVALPAGLVPVGTAGADSVVREYLSESL